MEKIPSYKKYNWIAVFVGDPRNEPEGLFQFLPTARHFAQTLANGSQATTRIIWYTKPDRKLQMERIFPTGV